MNRHSTLASYLEKLIWVLTGNFGKPGAQYAPTAMVALARGDAGGKGGSVSPVAKATIIGGLVPCNVIPEEILTDDPARYRAMLIESGNPAHSLADSSRMREALAALDLVVVIDVAMTETARLAHYVLPAPSQYEKWEATFFNFDFPANVFHLRRPLLSRPRASCPSPRSTPGWSRRSGSSPTTTWRRCGPRQRRVGPPSPRRSSRPPRPTRPWARWRRSCSTGRWADAARRRRIGRHPLGCGPPLRHDLPRCGAPGRLRGRGPRAGGAAVRCHPVQPVRPAVHGRRVRGQLAPGSDRGRPVPPRDPELLAELPALASPPVADPEYPFVLSAGERRSFTANTIFRDPSWRKRDQGGALRLHPDDASRIGVVDGGLARLTTKRGSLDVLVELSDVMQPGHISLPNGMGVDYPSADGLVAAGVAPNELTAGEDRDWLAGTPLAQARARPPGARGVSAPTVPRRSGQVIPAHERNPLTRTGTRGAAWACSLEGTSS
jgi:anaerobic selenocysteine-containing dehydrogenase